MADTKISALAAGAAITGAEIIVYVQGGVNKQDTLNNVKGFVLASISGTANRVSFTAGVIDIDAAYVGQASITTLGTITSGIWNANLIAGTYGGTGVNNGAKTITLGGNLQTTGAYNLIFAQSASCTINVIRSGTLALLDDVADSDSTIDATPKSLYIINCPASKVTVIAGYVVGRRSGGSGGTAEDVACYRVEFVANNIAGVGTVVGSVITVIGESNNAWDVTITNPGADANLSINVIGDVNNDINWFFTPFKEFRTA